MTKPLVVITGASSGIGAATAHEFATEGYPLLLLARRLEPMQGLGLDQAICRSVDVTDGQSVVAAIEDAASKWGPPDLLVNNAGIMPLGQVASQDPGEWQRLFDVNCVGLLAASQAVMPGMIERQRGTIINLGSIAGRNLYDNHAVYCGTKWAVHAMSEQIRREVAAHGVRVCVIAPGMTETELLDGTESDSIKDGYLAYKSQIGGAMDPRHIARAILSTYELPQEVCVRELVIAPTSQDA